MRFLLVIAGVENDMLDRLLLEKLAQQFALFDRDRADQDRLTALLGFADGLDDGLELLVSVLVELVVDVLALDRKIGRDFDHVELVDVKEFCRLGRRGAGHASQLRVEAEIILEGYRRQRLVFGRDLDAFLRLDRLVQSLCPAPSVHHPPGEFVDDDDLVLADDIIGIPPIDHVGAQRLIEVMDDLRIFEVVEVLTLE